MIKETIEIIKESETLILGRFVDGIPQFVCKFLTDLYFITAGISLWASPIKNILKILVPLLVITAVISYCFSLSQQWNLNLLMISFMIPIALVVFARPSKFCFERLGRYKVELLKEFMLSKGVNTVSKVSQYRELILLAKERVDKRNKKFNWLFGSFVAIAVFIFVTYSRLVFKIENFGMQNFFDSITMPTLVFIFITPILYLFVDSYKKVNDAVFHLIFICLIELDVDFKTINKVLTK